MKSLFHRKGKSSSNVPTVPAASAQLPIRQPSTAQGRSKPGGTLLQPSQSISSPVATTSRFASPGSKTHHDVSWATTGKDKKPVLVGRHAQAPWYIARPEISEQYRNCPELCANCSHIDFEYLFIKSPPRQTMAPEDYIRLGTMNEMSTNVDCPACTIIICCITVIFERDTAGKILMNPENERLISAQWYLSPFRYYHEQYSPGHQLYLRPNVFNGDQVTVRQKHVSHKHPSWPFVLRLFSNRPRGGRPIPRDHLSFDWIASTMSQCDKLSRMPPQKFTYPPRVVDVKEMCVVELPPNSPYICLSYCWGQVQTIKLNNETHDFLQSAGSLTSLGNKLPRTMQDAIVLTRRIGQRYIWIDALCILQGDPEDMKRQLPQMGKVYCHAYFTIIAISGTHANYGLPGVRPGSRNLQQGIQRIGRLTIANSMPWMEEEDLVHGGAWGSRGWTFQERFSTQRSLFIGDEGMIINCVHTYSPEDENCFHGFSHLQDLIAVGDMCFYSGQHKECVPYLGRDKTSFDYFAVMISEYSARKLTYQSDAENACLAVLDWLKTRLGKEWIYGLPEVEFDAALMWSPIGTSARRRDLSTGKPLFPSWSWLGWEGHAAWYWTLERDTFMTTTTVPIEWCDESKVSYRQTHSDPELGTNVHMEYDAWFTPDGLCVPVSSQMDTLCINFRKQIGDGLGLRRACDQLRQARPAWIAKYNMYWGEPALGRNAFDMDDLGMGDFRLLELLDQRTRPSPTYTRFSSGRLRLRTLAAYFYVVGKPFQRKKLYDMTHPIWRLSIMDEAGHLCGYIDVPAFGTNPAEWTNIGRRCFIVLSRSTINGRRDPNPDALGQSRRRGEIIFNNTPLSSQGGMNTYAQIQNYKHSTRLEDINEAGNFDESVYPVNRPWCMLNVMMLKTPKGYTPPAIPRNREFHDEDVRVWERDTIGRIHVDAFLAHGPRKEVVKLQ